MADVLLETDYTCNMADVLLETGTTTLHQHPGSQCFYGGVSVAHLFSFLCCVLWWGQCSSSF
jgi:hypothetical protein